MNAIKQFLSPQYLFQINTVYISPQEKLFLLAGGVLFLLAIVIKISSALAPNPVDKKFRQKFYGLFLFAGLGEILWYLCRYENATFFGSNFMAWLIVLISLIWLIVIAVNIIKNYGNEKRTWEKQQVKLKYLPK